MTGFRTATQTQRTYAAKIVAGAALALGVGVGLGGCNVDSYLDPSVIGRWEHTPTVTPILNGFPAYGDQANDLVETSEVSSDDLIPEVGEYRLGPGDTVQLTILDFYTVGAQEAFERTVSPRGTIDLPQVGRVSAQGKTEDELRLAVVEAIRDAELQQSPVVSARIVSQRQQTFSAIGGVANAGTYYVPEPNYRLLEALTAAGGFDESAPVVYVIRPITLDERVEGIGPGAGIPERGRPAQDRGGQGKSFDEILDELIDEQPADVNKGRVSPAQLSDGRTRGDDAVIDLIEGDDDSGPPADGPGGGGDGEAQTDWVYENGQWVRAERARRGGGRGQGEEDVPLVTQRVIEVPVAPLIAGDASYNVVVRPGDVVRVPRAQSGVVYLGGQVARPGTYNLPANGRLTLSQAIIASGGLSGLAIPERVDLTRRIGEDRQVTIRLDLRAIASATQPDLFLKPDDSINVGTNFWAYPLAVVRGGFRASYGFGFLLDRNFGNDVFGAPPVNRANGF